MVKFFNSVDKLQSIEPESTALIIGIINSISMIDMA
ncbi:hypothetical protein ACTFIY_009681 [Dictyostelium cf. discoideum]